MHIFVMITAVNAAHIVANQTGNNIWVALFEPIEFRIAITVVGISCNEAVFITINIAIELEIVSFLLFSFCSSLITFSPIGVAAFPKPKIFAIIFKNI